MIVRRACTFCLFPALTLPLVAFSATSSVNPDKTKIEDKIKLEEQQLVQDKKKLSAINLKLGLPAKKKADKTKASTPKATSKKPVSHWAGSNAQLGLVLDTGNTQSTNFTGGLNLVYKNENWANTAQLQMQLNRNQGKLTKQRYYASDQVQYSFSGKSKNFVYGHGELTDDKFSPYEYQVISSAGYGRDIIKTPTLSVSLQGGPGARYDVVQNDPKSRTNFVFYTQADASWQVTKNMSLSEQVQYTMGSPYSYMQAVTALTNKLTGNLALQVSYTIQYYSQIPAGSANTKKLDTITDLTLVYNF